ncbi:MAG: outer membrane protein assembly factor BamD [Proteobacteria bacterium]|nr:outer membrane protein assembly factor BamD [Pseudomonadota bacterium]
MFLSRPARGAVPALCLALLALAGCAHHKTAPNLSPGEIYKRAHKSLEAYDFNSAIKQYEALTARYPFTDEARQARLDLIYAYYRAGEGESATDAAETFIRENPTHPRVDYAWYIKGLVDFDKPPNAIESLFRADLSQRPPVNARKSFAAFKTVVEQYPKSEYAHDALQRMVYLRNRLANYEVHVARYYYKRGAYVAAAQRARSALDQFDGAPATQEALQILIHCYDQLHLTELAAQSREVYAANYTAGEPAPPKKSWWKFW